jgi:hypothetical protein
MTATRDDETAASTGPAGLANRADYGPVQLADWLGLDRWQFEYVEADGLIPKADKGYRRWSSEVARELAGRVNEIITTVGTEHPIGAWRAAERLSEQTGVTVEKPDISMLAKRGRLTMVDSYKGHPLYDVRAIDALTDTEVAELVAERQAWLAASVDDREAAVCFGWKRHDFEKVAAERGIKPGRFGRWARADLDALAADAELAEQVRADRLLGPDQAAAHLDIRRTDWDYAVAAGWIAPKEIIHMQVGRYRSVAVPMYCTADVEALLDVPGVDWEAVRTIERGQPSPLRGTPRSHRPARRLPAAGSPSSATGTGSRYGPGTTGAPTPGRSTGNPSRTARRPSSRSAQTWPRTRRSPSTPTASSCRVRPERRSGGPAPCSNPAPP